VLLVAIALLGWFAWGAFGTKIEYRKGRVVVQTGTVDDELLIAASALESKLRDGTPSPITITAPEALLDKFTEQLNQSISPQDRVVFPFIDMTAELDANQDVQSELREYVTPVVPEPLNMRTRQWFGTVTESEISETGELEDLMDGPPFDTMWVQIAGTVDISSILESYEGTDEFAGIPNQWFDEAIDIFDVEIQRQQQIDGGWTSPEVVAILPGHLTYRNKLADGEIDAIERDSIIRELRTGVQESIITPDFYTLKGLTPQELQQPEIWTAGVELEQSPLQLLETELDKATQEIQKQEISIEKIKEEIRGAGSGGGGVGGSGDDQNKERLRRKLAKAEEKLAGLIEAKEEIELEIEELKEANSIDEGESVLSGEIWVWGHDLAIESGMTYRYRMRVLLANPFFGHKPSLYPQQHALASSVELSSEQSEWSAPIAVQKSEQWFVKKAKAHDLNNPSSILERAYISIDVFKFSDGEWTKKSRDIRVGQPIAVEGMKEGLGWFVLDVVEDVQGEVTLLQNYETSQVIAQRPVQVAENDQLRQLLEQVRAQASAKEEEELEDNPDPDPGGGGGTGGGMGGPGGGGGMGGPGGGG
jgi:hypothetical protein